MERPEITREECSCNNKTLAKLDSAIFIKSTEEGLTEKRWIVLANALGVLEPSRVCSAGGERRNNRRKEIKLT